MPAQRPPPDDESSDGSGSVQLPPVTRRATRRVTSPDHRLRRIVTDGSGSPASRSGNGSQSAAWRCEFSRVELQLASLRSAQQRTWEALVDLQTGLASLPNDVVSIVEHALMGGQRRHSDECARRKKERNGSRSPTRALSKEDAECASPELSSPNASGPSSPSRGSPTRPLSPRSLHAYDMAPPRKRPSLSPNIQFELPQPLDPAPCIDARHPSAGEPSRFGKVSECDEGVPVNAPPTLHFGGGCAADRAAGQSLACASDLDCHSEAPAIAQPLVLSPAVRRWGTPPSGSPTEGAASPRATPVNQVGQDGLPPPPARSQAPQEEAFILPPQPSSEALPAEPTPEPPGGTWEHGYGYAHQEHTWDSQGCFALQMQGSDLQSRASSVEERWISLDRRRILTAKFKNTTGDGIGGETSISLRRASRLSDMSVQSRDSALYTCPLPLNPSNSVRLAFDLLSIPLLVFDMCSVPYMVAWGTELSGTMLVIGWCTFGFWSCGVVLNFVTGYVDSEQVVMQPRQIVKHYLRTWFLMDFLILALDFAGLMLEMGMRNSAGGQNLTPVNVAKVGRLFRVGRLVRVAAMVRQGQLRRTYSWVTSALSTITSPQIVHLTARVFNLVFLILYLSHLGCCVWFAVAKIPAAETGSNWYMKFLEATGGEAHDGYEYTYGLYWSVSTMFSGSSPIAPTNSIEAVFAPAVVILGLMFSSWLVSTLAATLIQFKSMNQDRALRMQELQRFLGQSDASPLLAVRVQQQVEERERSAMNAHITYKDVRALSLLSANMRAELLGNIYGDILTHNDLFRMCLNCLSDHLVPDLCCHAASFEAHSPGDVVFRSNSMVQSAYFVSWGVLEYTPSMHVDRFRGQSEDDSSMVQVTRGACACELALYVHWTTVGMLEVASPCELLLIGAEEFAVLLKGRRHREVQRFIRRYAQKLCDAIESRQPRMTDLECGIDRDLIVTQMSQGFRSEMSQIQLEALQRKNFLSGRGKFDRLREEVMTGRCYLTQNQAGKILRVVQVAILRVQRRSDRATLMEVMRSASSTGRQPLALPATKAHGEETPTEAMRRLISRRLPMLEGMHLSEPSMPRSDIKLSESYGVPTKYMRYEFSLNVDDETICENQEPGERERRGSRASLEALARSLGILDMIYLPKREKILEDFSPATPHCRSTIPRFSSKHSDESDGREQSIFAWLPEERLGSKAPTGTDGRSFSKDSRACSVQSHGSAERWPSHLEEGGADAVPTGRA